MSITSRIASGKEQLAKVWALSAPYFKSEDKWRARLLLGTIVALNLGGVYLAVLFNDWNRVFYDALQNKDQAVFWEQLIRFTYLAFGMIILAVYKFYLTQLLSMRWRAWMTKHYLQRWLAHGAFYRLELARFSPHAAGVTVVPDNPDQRIQEDLNQFTGDTISLSMGLLNAVITLVSFVGILWGLSGMFAFHFGGKEYDVPGFMVWLAVLYCLVSSVITHYIGRPQIALNFQQQRVEADFRHHMVRVREYSEAIALDKGEAVERQQLDGRFAAVLRNYLQLIKAQKRLIWFNVFFGQAAVVFPFLVAAPRFFSGALQLGDLVQTASAFGKVQESLSWFVDNYSNLASWRATVNRLTSFEESIQAQERLQIAETAANSGALTGPAVPTNELHTQDLQVSLPDGTPLLSHLALVAKPGDSILFKGPSGSGKSTLFRALAGIWPFTRGRVNLPTNAMFMPQRPYFPDGTLRDALAYPHPAADYTDAALRQALTDALLPQLADRLDETNAWGQKLSGGEAQRLAVARVLLKKPQWIFADEATSALDEPAERQIYERLRAQALQAGGALVSIAHRPGVADYHASRWELHPAVNAQDARFELQPS